MEIHKPKPWHGWREFLKEYLIIVVGVLTALAGEQAVEWLHWRHAASEAEAHMSVEMGANLVNATELLAIQPCLQGRVAELAAALQRADPIWKRNVVQRPEGGDASLEGRIMPLVAGSPGRQWPKAAWESALSSGAVGHLPQDHMDEYASLYRLAEVLRDWQRDVALADSELTPLGFDRPLSAAERTTFLGKLSKVDLMQNNMKLTAVNMLRQAQQLGLSPPARDLRKRMVDERKARGACVVEVKLPLS